MSPKVQDALTSTTPSLLNAVISSRRRALLPLGLLTFAGMMVYQMCLQPQTFTASVSIAVQQPSSFGGDALAALTGQSGPPKYIGIIRSRLLAERVARTVHLQEFYRLSSFQDAVDRLMLGVKIDERGSEGLLTIKVALPGPPYLMGRRYSRRHALERLTASAADAYAAALRDYYIANDNDRDTVLLRQADAETQRTKTAFDESVARLKEFVRSQPSEVRLPAASESASGSGESAPEPGAGLNQAGSLSQSLLTVDADIKAAEAAQASRSHLVSEQLDHLSSLPSEDPLLTQRRDEVNQAAAALDNLRILYGPDHPRVEVALAKLQLAQQRLKQQQQSIRANLTTPQIAEQSKLDSLRARRAALLNAINIARARFPKQRDTALELQTLEDELGVALTARKSAESEAAKLRLTAVSAQNRLALVDSALPPKSGSPGAITILLMSIMASLGVTGGWIALEYIRLSRQMTTLHAIHVAPEAMHAA